jgi:hypothetical protein
MALSDAQGVCSPSKDIVKSQSFPALICMNCIPASLETGFFGMEMSGLTVSGSSFLQETKADDSAASSAATDIILLVKFKLGAYLTII